MPTISQLPPLSTLTNLNNVYLPVEDTTGGVNVTKSAILGFLTVGYTGSVGSLGYTGSTGAGYTGSASTAAGYAGSLGYTGSAGAGYTGSASTASGYAGSQGYYGSVGYTGSASTASGYAGSLGYYGSMGYTGSASTASGYAGSIGYVGSSGIGYTGSASTATGYVGSAGVGTSVVVTNTSTGTLSYVLFASTSSGTGLVNANSPYLTYNPITGSLSTPLHVITSTATSTSTTTGALIVTGGIGVGGSLFLGGGLSFETANFLTATGTNQGTALQLIADTNVITTATTSGLGVVLPSGVGRELTVINRSTNSILVYPPVGASIDGAAINSATTVPPNGWLTVDCITTSNYYAIDPVLIGGTGILITQSNNGTLTITATGTTGTTSTFLINNTTTSTSTNSGALIVNGGVGIGGSLNVNSASSFTGALSVGGALNVQGTLNPVNINASGYLIATRTAVTGATLSGVGSGIYQPASGQLGFYTLGVAAGYFDSTQNLFLTSTTTSTSTQSGALVVSGGVGIKGSTNIGGNIITQGIIQSPYEIVSPMAPIHTGIGTVTTVTSIFTTTGVFPSNLTIDPTGRFIYVINQNGTISQLAINQTTGAISVITTATSSGVTTATTNAIGFTTDPTGRFLYVGTGLSEPGNSIAQFSINQTTGILTTVSNAINVGTSTGYIVAEPSGRFVYASEYNSNSIAQFAINQTTGVLTTISNAIYSNAPVEMATDATGRFLYASNGVSISQYSINQNTGVLNTLTSISLTTTATSAGITTEPTGRYLYAATGINNSIAQFAINQNTGILTTVTSSFYVSQPIVNITVDPTGRFLYGITINPSPNLNIFSINQFTGALTTVTSNLALNAASAYAPVVDATGKYVFIAQDMGISQYAINNLFAGSGRFIGPVYSNGIQIGYGYNPPVSQITTTTLIVASGPNAFYRNTFTGSITIGVPTGATDGDRVRLWLTAGATTSTSTITLSGSIKIPSSSGTTFPVSVNSGTKVKVLLEYDGILNGGQWELTALINGY